MPGFEIQFEAVDQASPTIQKLSQQLLESAQRSDQFARDVTLSTQQADQALANLPSRAQQASQSMSTLQQAGQSLAAELLKFATVASVAEFFKSSAQSALSEEEALNKLQFAVNSTGGSFVKSKDQVLAFADQQQELTQFSNTQTFEAMSRLVRITGDVSSSMQATRLVFGLAAASGKDFNSVIDLLGPILNGDSTRLRALKEDFGAYIGDAKSAQQVINNLSKAFLGAAETQSGYQKEILSLQNRLNEFKQTVGAGVLPVFTGFLTALTKGAEFFEQLGVVAANFAAETLVSFQALGNVIQAVFSRNFSGIVGIVKDAGAKIDAIEDASAQQAAEIQQKYHQQVQQLATTTADLRIRKTQDVVVAEQKAGDDLKKLIAERIDAEGKASSVRGEQEQAGLQARLILIQVEQDARVKSFEELARKGLITEQQLTEARQNAAAIAVAQSKQATQAIDDNFLVIKGTEEAVASSLSSSFGKAVADIILTGKSLEDAMKAVFDTILRTAIETFTKIAIERAIIEAGVGAGTGGAAGGGGGLISGFLGSIGLADGGIVTRPIFAHVGESGPEAVIPLDRLRTVEPNGSSPAGAVSAPTPVASQPVVVNVTQQNTINLSGSSDSQVQDLMRQMARVTRSGAAAGAELVKSITTQQAKTTGQAV